MTTTQDAADDAAATSAVADRFFTAVVGALEMQAAFLGDRMGWYEALATGPLTAPELAERTETDARYAREWLEHQTVSGYLTVDDPSKDPDERRFVLPVAHRAVFTDRDSLAFMLPLAGMTVEFGSQLDRLAAAYQSGAGLSWAEHGPLASGAQASLNRPMFLQLLGKEYLASIPAVDAALRGGGRVADIGCGYGWSSIGVALAYPDATVDGYDIHGPSIDAARANAALYGVADRVRFHHVDAATIVEADELEPYDLVMALECIHDMSDPVSALATMRELTAPDGTTLVMDERVGEHFTGQDDPIERFLYGCSLLCCLPDGRSDDPSAATGTVMRPATLRAYADGAGFAGVTELPIDNDDFRFYRLDR